MKKSLLLIVLIISGFIGFAQLEVKEGSFKKVDGFVNINIEKMYDDNEKPYAVLKIKTENINDKQRRELSFGGDAQTFFETEYRDGEIWLYISYYATFLKISHPDLSSTEFWFPYDMEPKRGYELTLVYKPAIDEEIISRIEKLENASNENETKYGYIIITTPTDGATVYINGKEMEMKTPFASDKLEYGEYMVKVVMDQNNSFIDIVTLNEPKKVINVVFMNKNRSIKRSIRQKGWGFRPEFGIGYISRKSSDYQLYSDNGRYVFYVSGITTLRCNININYGYFINKYVYFGAGTGLSYLNKSLATPIYFDSRVYFSDRNVSTYFDIRFGYNFNIISINNGTYDYCYYYDFYNNKATKITDYKYYAKGIFLSFGIGLEHKHSSIKLSICMLSDGMTLTYNDPSNNSVQTYTATNTIFEYRMNRITTGLILTYSYNIWGIK